MKFKLLFLLFTFAFLLSTSFAQYVGIGTTTPQSKLHVNDSVSVNTVINITNSNAGTTNQASIALKNFTPTNDRALQFLNSFTGAFPGTRLYHFLDANTGSIFSIYNNGNVAIGAITPKNKLDIAGGLAVGTSYAGVATVPVNGAIFQGSVGVGTSTPQNRLDVFGGAVIGTGFAGTTASPAEGLLIQGSVGIGVATPQNRLDVEGSAVIGSSYSGTNTAPLNSLLVEGKLGLGTSAPQNKLDVNGGAVIGSGYAGIIATPADGLLIQGSVGIGVITPKNKLDIEGSAVVGSTYSGTNTAPVNGLLIEGQLGLGITTPVNKLDVNGGAVIGSGYAGNAATPADGLLIQGNVGIGVTTPQNKLDIEGNAVIGSSYSGTSIAPANSLLVEGKLGLGTPSPQNKLDVNGGAVVGSGYAGTIVTPADGLLIQGSVGIGVTTPKNKLDVEGGAVIGSTYSGTNTAPVNGLLVEGQFGLGITTPVNKLDVNGGAVIGSSYSGTSIAPANSLLIEGKLGLGTSSPQNKLDINGGAVIGSSYAGNVATPADGLLVQGNIGVGTTTPGGALDIGGKTIVSATDGSIRMEGTKNTTHGIEWLYSADDRYGLAQASGGNLGIYAAKAFGASFISFNLADNAGFQELMRITHNGNVGIGVTTPQNKLDVEGSAVIGSSYSGANTAPVNSLLVEGKLGLGTPAPVNKLDVNGGAVIGSAYSGATVAPVNGMLVQGFVGIGTINPGVPLEVGTQTTVGSIGTYGYLNPAAMVGTSNAVNIPVSIKASARILSIEFNAYSDQRIKRNITTSSSQKDLETLLKIRVANYQLKDSIYNGNTPVKGFIAQELQTVMPQAVNATADYVPDIYCLSSSTEYNEKEKTLKVSLCKPHQLKVGDKVKAFAGDGMQEQYVSVINNETTFTLNNWEIKQAGMNPVEKVFVWGKWVTDFHTVDYNQVFSLGISAIQQLAKENEELKKELKTTTSSLQQQIDELKKILLNKNKK